MAWVQSDGPHQMLAPLALEGPLPKHPTLTKPGPGQLMLCAHACVLGAASATSDMLCGKATADEWGARFQTQATQAAASVTPVGACALRQLFPSHAQCDTGGEDVA